MTCMAADRGEPSRDQLLAWAKLDDREEEWQDLGRYVAYVSSKYMHEYVPFSGFLKPHRDYGNGNGHRDSSIMPEAIFQVKQVLGGYMC